MGATLRNRLLTLAAPLRVNSVPKGDIRFTLGLSTVVCGGRKTCVRQQTPSYVIVT